MKNEDSYLSLVLKLYESVAYRENVERVVAIPFGYKKYRR